MGATLEIQRQQQLEVMEQQLLLSRARESRDRGNSGVRLLYALIISVKFFSPPYVIELESSCASIDI